VYVYLYKLLLEKGSSFIQVKKQESRHTAAVLWCFIRAPASVAEVFCNIQERMLPTDKLCLLPLLSL